MFRSENGQGPIEVRLQPQRANRQQPIEAARLLRRLDQHFGDFAGFAADQMRARGPKGSRRLVVGIRDRTVRQDGEKFRGGLVIARAEGGQTAPPSCVGRLVAGAFDGFARDLDRFGILVIPEIAAGDDAQAFAIADRVENLPVPRFRKIFKRLRHAAALNPIPDPTHHLAHFGCAARAVGGFARGAFSVPVVAQSQVVGHRVLRLNRITPIAWPPAQGELINLVGIRMIRVLRHPGFQFLVGRTIGRRMHQPLISDMAHQ